LAYHSLYNAFFIDLPVPSFMFHSSLLTVKTVDLVVALPLRHGKFSVFFILTTLITQLLSNTSRLILVYNGLSTAGNEDDGYSTAGILVYNSYFAFQMIIGIHTGVHDVLNAVCVGSPVIIIIYKKLTNYVYSILNNWNFQPE